MLQADGMTDTFQPDVSIDARPGAAPYALVNALRTTAILGAMSTSTDGTLSHVASHPVQYWPSLGLS
jgi:hypothetical protein